MASDGIRETAVRVLHGGTRGSLNHLITGVVMAGSFLVGFLPIYTGFLDRLGGYDAHFRVIDERLDRVEKDIGTIIADVKTGNALTATRLDTVLQRIGETRELILTKGAR